MGVVVLTPITLTDGILYRKRHASSGDGDIALFDGLALVGTVGAFRADGDTLVWHRYDARINTGVGSLMLQRNRDGKRQSDTLDVIGEGLSVTLYHDLYRDATYMPCEHHDPELSTEGAFVEAVAGGYRLVFNEGDVQGVPKEGIAGVSPEDDGDGVLLRYVDTAYTRCVSYDAYAEWDPVATVARIDRQQNHDR